MKKEWQFIITISVVVLLLFSCTRTGPGAPRAVSRESLYYRLRWHSDRRKPWFFKTKNRAITIRKTDSRLVFRFFPRSQGTRACVGTPGEQFGAVRGVDHGGSDFGWFWCIFTKGIIRENPLPQLRPPRFSSWRVGFFWFFLVKGFDIYFKFYASGGLSELPETNGTG